MILSYTEPFNRKDDTHLLPADITRAVEYFKGFGELKRLFVNPMYLNEKYKTFLKADYPEDVEVLDHAGVASWEIQGEIKEGTKIPEDKNTGGQTLPNTADKQQGAKGHVKELSGGGMTPTEENKPSDFDLVGCKTIPSCKNGAILTKRCINPAFRKKYPAQNEKLL